MGKWVRQVNNLSQVDYVMREVSDTLKKGLQNGRAAVVTLTRPTRSLAQNRLLWPLLADFSKQVDHFGNQYTPDQWKDLLTASFSGCQEYAPSLDGRSMIAFGVRTSEWPQDTFSQFIEFVFSEGSERGVSWSNQSKANYQEVTA